MVAAQSLLNIPKEYGGTAVKYSYSTSRGAPLHRKLVLIR